MFHTGMAAGPILNQSYAYLFREETPMSIVNIKTLLKSGLQCPPGKRRIEYVSHERTGLYLEVRATSPGEGTYYLRFKNKSGKTCHQKLGRTTEINLDQARQKVKELKAKITLGEYPGDEDHDRLNTNMSFSDYWEQLFLPYISQRIRSAKKYDEYYRLRLKNAFGNMRLDEIRRHHIESFLTEIRKDLSPASCNRYLATLKRAFSFSVDSELLEKSPARTIRLFHEESQIERYLNEEELQRLMTVLATHPNRTVSLIVQFLLLTGCRKSEALYLRWEYVDLKNRIARLPANVAKGKKIRTLVLSEQAVEVLKQLDTREKYSHCFINKQTGKPYTTIDKSFRRLIQLAGIENFRIHDCRHTFISYVLQSGGSLFEAQRLASHSSSKVTARYAHLSTKSLQEAANNASDIISGAVRKAG